jgi:hypothetical protein
MMFYAEYESDPDKTYVYGLGAKRLLLVGDDNLAARVAELCNRAMAAGKAEAKREIRAALGLPSDK